jgi:hypothetical protein
MGQSSACTVIFSRDRRLERLSLEGPRLFVHSLTVKCWICDEPAAYYFSKRYGEGPYAAVCEDLGVVDYWRCGHCGFVMSKTHAEMPRASWERLNKAFHDYADQPDAILSGGQPPVMEQAAFIALLHRNGLAFGHNMLDYASGRGYLSAALSKYFSLAPVIYEPYIDDRSVYRLLDPTPKAGTYHTVINSAMFEHVLCRADLNAVNNVVRPDGVLIIHTVVCENVPNDPKWFYLDPPVHTAFHTNASMALLMEQWGYRSSIYSPRSKCWALLRQDYESVAPKVAAINRELQTEWLIGKSGFVDYWKGF